MEQINILRGADTHYRYKMPRLVLKTEGRGNGIKTALLNITDVAKALNRPVAYLVKFFGMELGTMSVCDEKKQRFLITGAHTGEILQEILYTFIDKFVLCQACTNPETLLEVDRKKIVRKCLACGSLTGIDMAHKLSGYLLKNPPKHKVCEQAGQKLVGTRREEKYLVFVRFVQENCLVWQEIRQQAQELGLRQDRAIALFVQALLVESPLERFHEALPLLRDWVQTEADVRGLLGGIERVSDEAPLEKTIFIPSILQQLYMTDFLTIEQLKHWRDFFNTAYVTKKNALDNRQAAKSFFEWLEESASESE